MLFPVMQKQKPLSLKGGKSSMHQPSIQRVCIAYKTYNEKHTGKRNIFLKLYLTF